MSRSHARDPRDTTVRAMVLTTRRLAAAVLVIAAGIAAAQPAIARVAPHHPRKGLTALRSPGPGAGAARMSRGGRAGGGQVIKGGRAGAGQDHSGEGRFNQSLNGVMSPTFIKGQAQQAVTDHGSFDVQGAFCGSEPDNCLIGQTMPIRRKS